MKLKDLFKTLEGANYIASQAHTPRVHICADTIGYEDGYALCVINVRARPNTYFHTFADFKTAIKEDYTPDVLELVMKGELMNPVNGVFTLADKNICADMAFRIWIFRD